MNNVSHNLLRNSHVRGFSLVELMVSLTIFSIVMLVGTGTLLVLVNANAKAQAISSAMTNLTFALDSMSRNIRTGKNYYCTDGSTLTGALPAGTQDCSTGGTGIVFTPGLTPTTRIAYRFISNRVEQRIDRNGVAGPWLPITNSQQPFGVLIDRVAFLVVGAANTGGGDYNQPYITFFLSGAVSNGLDTATPFEIQSQVTQRVLNY